MPDSGRPLHPGILDLRDVRPSPRPAHGSGWSTGRRWGGGGGPVRCPIEAGPTSGGRGAHSESDPDPARHWRPRRGRSWCGPKAAGQPRSPSRRAPRLRASELHPRAPQARRGAMPGVTGPRAPATWWSRPEYAVAQSRAHQLADGQEAAALARRAEPDSAPASRRAPGSSKRRSDWSRRQPLPLPPPTSCCSWASGSTWRTSGSAGPSTWLPAIPPRGCCSPARPSGPGGTARPCGARSGDGALPRDREMQRASERLRKRLSTSTAAPARPSSSSGSRGRRVRS